MVHGVQASSVQKTFNNHSGSESWAIQNMLIEQPLVKAPGTTPCSQGFHHYFGSRGSSVATLEELNPSIETPVLNRTKLARDVLLAKEKERRRKSSTPPWSCQVRQESHDSQIM